MPSNKNALSKLILSIAQGKMVIPKLTDTEPIEILLDIGLEKLTNDFQTIFSSANITSLNWSNTTPAKSEAESGTNLNVRKSLYNAVAFSRQTNGGQTNGHYESGYVNYNEDDVNYKLAKLAQTHLLLEHLLLIEENLGLEHGYSGIANEYLKRQPLTLSQLQNKKFDKLKMPITSNKVFHMLVEK
jgi:protein zwilch